MKRAAIRNRLPGNNRDDEADYIEPGIKGVIVTSLYLPNGNPSSITNSIGSENYRHMQQHSSKPE